MARCIIQREKCCYPDTSSSPTFSLKSERQNIKFLKIIARYMQGICKVSARYMQGICKVCARYMQGICKVYARHMLGICKVYARHMQGTSICKAFARYMQGTTRLTDRLTGRRVVYMRLICTDLQVDQKCNFFQFSCHTA